VGFLREGYKMDFGWNDIVKLTLYIIGGAVLAWKNWIKPLTVITKDNTEIKSYLETIKKEVTTNGGKSIKDAINSLKITCERMEIVQKIIEQRSKSSLHYNDNALFETDENGHLVWLNEKFYELTGKSQSDMEGYDWISYIRSEERDRFLLEFGSCLKMCRKLEFVTFNFKDQKIKLVGYPYKTTEETHGGFLIHISFV
jgi:PAS domain S-box-containing protein